MPLTPQGCAELQGGSREELLELGAGIRSKGSFHFCPHPACPLGRCPGEQTLGLASGRGAVLVGCGLRTEVVVVHDLAPGPLFSGRCWKPLERMGDVCSSFVPGGCRGTCASFWPGERFQLQPCTAPLEGPGEGERLPPGWRRSSGCPCPGACTGLAPGDEESPPPLPPAPRCLGPGDALPQVALILFQGPCWPESQSWLCGHPWA